MWFISLEIPTRQVDMVKTHINFSRLDIQQKFTAASSAFIGAELEMVKSFKIPSLNIIISLTWVNHIEAMAKKMHRYLYLLRRLRNVSNGSYTIECIPLEYTISWFENSSAKDHKLEREMWE